MPTPRQLHYPCTCSWIQPSIGCHHTGTTVQQYFQASLAPSTKRTYMYNSGFNTFCEPYQSLDPFPVTELLLCSFAASLADDGLAMQRVKSCSI